MMILVTGGAGFIGSNFLHFLMNKTDEEVAVIDCITYAGNVNNIPISKQIKFYNCDITDFERLKTLLVKIKPRVIFHFAAESHVDRSIENCTPFLQTNIIGTVNLITNALELDLEKFHHISTDEVYGTLEIDEEKLFTENTPYGPRNPYSASKSSSDHFVLAWHHTYGLPFIITNCSNNYGPRQHPEKLIPKVISRSLKNEKTYMHGGGHQIRDWLYVKDHCEAIWAIEINGIKNQKFNIGGNCEMKNIDVTKKILDKLHKSYDLIGITEDRLGQDLRYGTDNKKILEKIGWSPNTTFDDGLTETINWYTKSR